LVCGRQSLVAALGLVVAGFLFRIAMKIAGVRRGRIIVDRPESHWVDANEHELRDEQQYAESIHQREELIDEFIDRPESDWMDDRNEHELRDGEHRSGLVHQEAKLIDDLQGSVILTASDDTPHRLFRNNYELQEKPSTETGSRPVVAITKGGVAHPRAIFVRALSAHEADDVN
jgi:hypothetical protein